MVMWSQVVIGSSSSFDLMRQIARGALQQDRRCSVAARLSVTLGYLYKG